MSNKIRPDSIKLPNKAMGYFRRMPTGIKVQDPHYFAWATERLKKIPEVAAQFDLMKKTEAEAHEFAGLPNFQPTKRYAVPMGIGSGPQQAMIGTRIMPEFMGGPDEQGYYPVYGREGFYVDPKGNKVGIGGTVKRLDVKLSFGTVDTQPRAIEVLTEDREASIAAAVLNIQLDSYKLDVAQKSLAAEKESDIADTVLATGSYASASFYETLAGSDQWTHDDSEPIGAFWTARRMLFVENLADPDLFAMGGATEAALMMNKQILSMSAIAKTGQGRPSAPVTRDFLAALFQIEIAVGNAASLAEIDDTTSTPTQIWGDFAGLYCTGPNAVVAPRFGVTVGREGYPSLLPYRDNTVGVAGANVFKWADCWKPKVTKSNAGYLWLDCE